MLKSLRLKRLTAATGLTVACLLAVAGASNAGAAEPAPEAATQAAGVSQAEQLYREGVTLYSKEMYREAQSAFNRALALDPEHENAKKLLRKCEGKIEMVSAGEKPGVVPSFDTLDPETIPTEANGGVPRTAETSKFERTKELITQGQFFLENKKFNKAKDTSNKSSDRPRSNRQTPLGKPQSAYGDN